MVYDSGVFPKKCGRNEKVIEQTFRMVERAFTVASKDSDFATELGYQMVLQGRIREAMKWYKTAMTLDETSVAALTGYIFVYNIYICIIYIYIVLICQCNYIYLNIKRLHLFFLSDL